MNYDALISAVQSGLALVTAAMLACAMLWIALDTLRAGVRVILDMLGGDQGGGLNLFAEQREGETYDDFERREYPDDYFGRVGKGAYTDTH